MKPRDRREFFADVGKGMLVAGVGPSLLEALGISVAFAEEDDAPLRFGPVEELVSLMQETPPDVLQPLLVQRLRAGTDLRALVAAGALANARAFGGQNYIGYHTLMALPPALSMAAELPEDRSALPVLKVLYRNAKNIHRDGGRKDREDVLKKVRSAVLPDGGIRGEALREIVRRGDMQDAERTFAALCQGKPQDAFDDLQFIVQDSLNVHRVVLAYRSWTLLDITGSEHAHTLLRQSVRFCVDHEHSRAERQKSEPRIRTVLPRLLDEYRLVGRPLGTKVAEDRWVEKLVETMVTDTAEAAAEAVAVALAEGFHPDVVGEALSLAANQLVLRDPGRKRAKVGKPVGSVHGDSVGVHASDAANAWRNIAAVCGPRQRVASLLAGAYHTAGEADGLRDSPYPSAGQLEQVQGKDPAALLVEIDAAIRNQDQFRACATVQRYGELDGRPRPLFDVLLSHATSEDGALHAEKYYHTGAEEFARTRPAFRWRHAAALARVTASEYGTRADGYEDACRLLGV